MKIVNICLAGPFTDGFNYQENIITKYQAKMGNEVYILASKWQWNGDGKLAYTEQEDYINENQVHIYRLSMIGKDNVTKKFKRYYNINKVLEKIHPDIIFIHGCQFLDIKKVLRYVKKNNCIVYIDNHADFSNSATNFISKYFLHKIIWKHYAKKIEPYVSKFYGVLPARVDFLVNMYSIPKNKVELLVMGADDEKVESYCTVENAIQMKNKYHVDNKKFLIVTGGKIDSAKLQTLLLMEAVNNLNKVDSKFQLIIFGSIDDNIKEDFNKLCNENVNYIGWIDNDESYKLFNMADIVVFPGRHSVYWEQVVGIGKPLICKYWPGTTHIDIGGNVLFLKSDSVEEIEKSLIKVTENNFNYYKKMLSAAHKNTKNKFLYSEIAKSSISHRK